MDPHLSLDIHVPRRAFAVKLALELGPGTVAVLGPSGAGKSTLLRAVAGLERPRAGRIALGAQVWFDAERRIALAPERRAVGLVPQDLALFPHLTSGANVAFGGRRRAGELMRRFGIAHLADAMPATLSGGERQRVALARALARGPARAAARRAALRHSMPTPAVWCAPSSPTCCASWVCPRCW